MNWLVVRQMTVKYCLNNILFLAYAFSPPLIYVLLLKPTSLTSYLWLVTIWLWINLFVVFGAYSVFKLVIFLKQDYQRRIQELI